MSKSRRCAAFGLVALAVFLVFEGCGALPQVHPCGEIPQGGCPTGRGGSCDDETCLALYDCIDARWLLSERCPGNPGPTQPDAGPDVCTPVAFDHALQKTGCQPDLEAPDCPSEAAEGCAESACITGCVDFFQCRASGWTDIAYCDDQGHLVISTVP